MAIRQTKSGTWQVYWRNPVTGKQEARNFKTKKEAKKENSLILYRLSTEPESFNTEEKVKESITFEQVVNEYLTKHSFAKKTVKKFLNISVYFTNVDIKSITSKDIENIQKLFKEKKLASSSIYIYMSAIKTIFYYAFEQGYCERFKFPKIPMAKYERIIPPTFEELQKMLDVAIPHIKRVIIIGAYFGARVGSCELFQLTWEDVDFAKEILRIHGSRKNMNAQYREVPIQKALIPVLQAWKDEDKNKGFIIHYRGNAVKDINDGWRNTLKRAGITRRIRPYDLRHTFGTELVAAGIDIGTVAELMGHSNPTMLLNHYQYVLKKQKREAVEALKSINV